MTAATINARQPSGRGEVGRAFYLWISSAMAAVFVGGFSGTVPRDFLGTPALPLLLHVHGAISTLWVALVVAQPAFIARGSLRLHRRVGWAGTGLAAVMVVMGVAATWFSIQHHAVPPFFPPAIFLVMNLVGMMAFAAFVGAGIVLRRQREWHKRLMVCATISILGPGLGRLLPMPAFGTAAPLVMFAAILSFAVAGMVADRIVRGRIHPAYLWGTGAILLTDLAIGPLASATPTLALLRLIQAS